ncbi:hypothetical protein CO667_30365 [Rhizobium sp. L43]|nr:hypothetical protein CO667_30365 [Rhizobium sp. L43]
MSSKRKQQKAIRQKRSAVAANEVASRARRALALGKLIADLELLVSRSSGLRHYSYKLRLYNARIALKRLKRSAKERFPKGERTTFVVNPKGFQAGAPGLIQQKRR